MKFRMLWGWVIVLLGCGGTENIKKNCTPNAQVECACLNGNGIQTCKNDGSGFNECVCGDGAGGNGGFGVVENGGGNGEGGGSNMNGSSSVSNGGSLNSGGSGGSCISLTCEDVGVKSCGSLDDNCGGTLDCGNCDSDTTYEECGMGDFNSDGTFDSGVNNQCGGGCAYVSDLDGCDSGTDSKYICAFSGYNQPPGTEGFDHCYTPSGSYGSTWCCIL